MNDQFLWNAFKNVKINVWSTESGYKVGNDKDEKSVINSNQIVLALDLEVEYNLTCNSFEKNNGIFISNMNNYIIRNWHKSLINCGNNNGQNAIESECVTLIQAQNSMDDMLYVFEIKEAIKPSNESFELVVVTEANSFDDIVFLGELNKYVSVSQHRFSNLDINGNRMSVDIRGEYNEIVNVTYLYPLGDSSINDWKIVTKGVSIPQNGTMTMIV